MEKVLAEGTVVDGRYRIEKVIGEGAAGTVYLVDAIGQPGVRWALKEIISAMPESAEQHDAVAMFERECEILKSLNHPGLPKIIEHFVTDRGHCLVMEYVEGESLQLRFKARREPYSPADILPWMLQLLDILEYLHRQSPPVIFRDLKPSNIVITTGGRAKLIDFGIARCFSPEKMRDTFVMGTPGFSAPEQYGNRQTDARSDIYSFGATVYYLLTGEDLEQFAFKIPPATDYNAAVPLWLSEALSRCLAPAVEQRFQNAAELRKTIENRSRDSLHTHSAPSLPVSSAAPASPQKPKFLLLLDDNDPWKALLYCFILIGLICVPFVGWLCGLAGTLGLITLTILSFISTMSHLVKGNHHLAWLAFRFLASCLIIISIPAFFVVPNYYRARSSGQLCACKCNMKNIGTALEMYFSDNKGLYPYSLGSLTPNYLKVIPTCASAGRDTYSSSYTLNSSNDIYTIYCNGNFHKVYGFHQNWPQYDSINGLVDLQH